VEQFKDAPAIYRLLAERGRMMPEGLKYISSWIEADLKRCFQLMEASDRQDFDQWIANWSDLMEFEIYPVIDSSQAAGKALGPRPKF
jgi:hypothetical protein